MIIILLHSPSSNDSYSAALSQLKYMRIWRNKSTVHDLCKFKTDADFVINRNSSYPFVTGDTFREIADCILDESQCPLDPKTCVFEGAIVFVKCDLEEMWFRDYHPKVQNHYVLITHTGDLTAPHSDVAIRTLDSPLLLAWFACNLGMRHSKLIAIPHGHNVIGRPNGIPGLYAKIWGESIDGLINRWNEKFSKPYLDDKDRAIAIYFSVGSNPRVRAPVLSCLQKNGFRAGAPMPYESLMKHLNRFFFVAAPPGNGIDCVRTWESFESSAVPIVQRGLNISGIWKELPVVEVDDYCQVTIEFLHKQWETIRKKKYDFQRVYAQYWLVRIFIAAKRIKSNYPIFDF